MKTFVKENTWLSREYADYGWGNGYVVIPKGHPLNGKQYDEIHEMIPELDVHGRLTFSDSVENLKEWKDIPENSEGGWVVGFDTAHFLDDLSKWSKSDVMRETERLKEQLMFNGIIFN